MEVLEAIFARRSVGQVKPDPVPGELLEKLLSAAVQAPNHHKVRRWRFVIMTGQAREKLGEAMAQSLHAAKPEATVDDLQRERLKPLRAPVLVAVAVDKPTLPKVIEIENVCAAAAAVQNLLLAAHALGLGAMWRTGAAWATPGEVGDLRISWSGNDATLAWSPPSDPGGIAPLYDVIRSASPGGFGTGAAACVESGGADTAASDPAWPAVGFFYLVRASNACGVGSAGADASGTERPVRLCP